MKCAITRLMLVLLESDAERERSEEKTLKSGNVKRWKKQYVCVKDEWEVSGM